MSNYLVIGGTSGIGLETAKGLKSKGHDVWVTGRKKKEGLDEDLQFQELDIDGEIDLGFLPEELHGLVYAPGTINLKPFHRFKEKDFLEDYQINVMGAIKSIQAALPKLKNADSASVVLYSTVAVRQGMSFHASIASAKGAIEGLVRSLAAEYAPGIRFNAIAPSLTDTPQAERLLNNDKKRESGAQRHPLKRVGEANDISSLTCFLLQDNGSWITGQVIGVDGGMSALRPI